MVESADDSAACLSANNIPGVAAMWSSARDRSRSAVRASLNAKRAVARRQASRAGGPAVTSPVYMAGPYTSEVSATAC